MRRHLAGSDGSEVRTLAGLEYPEVVTAGGWLEGSRITGASSARRRDVHAPGGLLSVRAAPYGVARTASLAVEASTRASLAPLHGSGLLQCRQDQ